MSVSRKLLHQSTNSAAPASISEAEIIDLINHLPFGGDRWNTAIDAVVQILDAVEAKDLDSLREFSNKGGKLPKRLASVAVALLEQDDAFTATIGPELALKYFFQFSRHYSFARRAWMAENRNRGRIPERQSTTEGSDTEPSLEEVIEAINQIGETTGARLQLFALCGREDLITPELATAMLNVAYDALGLPLKPSAELQQKGGE